MRTNGWCGLVIVVLVGYIQALQAQTTTSPDSSAIGFKPPPAAFLIGDLGISSAFVMAGYAHISPNWSATESMYGLSFGAMTTPFNMGEGEGVYGPALDVILGYNVIDQIDAIKNENIGASLIWNRPSLRFGPALGYQANPSAFNIGGFGEWFASTTLSLFFKLGKFTGGTSGTYLGGSVFFFMMPDLAFIAGVVNADMGFNQTDLTASAEYLVSETTPITIFGGYTYSGYQPGLHATQLFAGARFLVNGDGVSTLIERQRTGTPPPHQYKF